MRALLILFSFSLLMVACQSSTQESQETTESDLFKTNESVTIPQDLTTLFTSDDGVFRTFDFNSSKSNIQDKETAEALEEEASANTLVYSTDIDEANFADFFYHFDNNDLSKIEVDVYTPNSNEAQRLYTSIKTYFDSKYTARKSIWDGTDGTNQFTIFLDKVETKENNGCAIVFEQL